jgi:hypothetical protein
MSLVGAVGGGVAGAVLWSIVARLTGLEIGYVAWAVGGMVGIGCYSLGGRGQAAGAFCAVVALVSIVAGKALTIQQFVSGVGIEGVYQQLLPQAEAFVAIESDEGYPEFMVRNQYTDARRPQDVKEEEVVLFKTFAAPLLEDLGRNKPAFEEWKEKPVVQAYFGEVASNSSVLDILVDSLGPIDLIFALLGVGTAFQICMRDERRVARLIAPLRGHHWRDSRKRTL